VPLDVGRLALKNKAPAISVANGGFKMASAWPLRWLTQWLILMRKGAISSLTGFRVETIFDPERLFSHHQFFTAAERKKGPGICRGLSDE